MGNCGGKNEERRESAPGSVGNEIPRELRVRMRAVMNIDGQDSTLTESGQRRKNV